MAAVVRSMLFEDLSGVTVVQSVAYTAKFWEHPSTFLGKWVSHPAGCFVAVLAEELALSGYAITHPWTITAPPPSLNAGISHNLPLHPDCLYIHDVAVHPSARGAGVSRLLFDKVCAHAGTLALKTITLVAVDGAATYWAKLGFVDQTSTLDVTVQKGIRTNYGTDARSGPPPHYAEPCSPVHSLTPSVCAPGWMLLSVCIRGCALRSGYCGVAIEYHELTPSACCALQLHVAASPEL
jgi:GNAT superfamily N-acetyltransferase